MRESVDSAEKSFLVYIDDFTGDSLRVGRSAFANPRLVGELYQTESLRGFFLWNVTDDKVHLMYIYMCEKLVQATMVQIAA